MTAMQRDWEKRTVLFFLSQCITLFGSQIVQMAIVWYVTLETSSGGWVAAFSVCSYLPQFFISFLGGVWADRYSGKLLILSADALIAAVTAVMMLMMPRITGSGGLLAALLIMSILRSAGAGIQTPAVNAMIPQLVPEEERMRWNGIFATMQSVVQFVAPAAAAVILTANSLRSTLMLDVLTALVGIGMVSYMILPKQNESKEKSSVLKDMNIGIRYACGNIHIRNILLMYGSFLFWSVPAGYLAGLFVSRSYGDTYWYLTAVEVVGFGGMMAGGLIMSIWGGFRARRNTLAAGLALFGIMAIAMAVSRQFLMYLGFMAIYGIALTVVQTAITTILQEKTEVSMQGRVFGLMSALYSSCYPVGMALFGTMSDRIALSWLMILSGIALAVLAWMAYRLQDL